MEFDPRKFHFSTRTKTFPKFTFGEIDGPKTDPKKFQKWQKPPKTMKINEKSMKINQNLVDFSQIFTKRSQCLPMTYLSDPDRTFEAFWLQKQKTGQKNDIFM